MSRADWIMLGAVGVVLATGVAFIGGHDGGVRQFQLTASQAALEACAPDHGMPSPGNSIRVPFASESKARERDTCLMSNDPTYPGFVALQMQAQCLQLEAKHGAVDACKTMRESNPRLASR